MVCNFGVGFLLEECLVSVYCIVGQKGDFFFGDMFGDVVVEF